METAPTGDWNISATVKKADSSIIEKPLELEGEGGSSVNYLDVTISIRRNRLRWTLYDKKKFIFIDGKALSESPNFPWYDSKLTERSKVLPAAAPAHRKYCHLPLPAIWVNFDCENEKK